MVVCYCYHEKQCDGLEQSSGGEEEDTFAADNFITPINVLPGRKVENCWNKPLFNVCDSQKRAAAEEEQ